MSQQLFHDAPTGLGAAMQGSGPKTLRRANDFYPTPANVTQALLDREIYRIRSHGGTVWEPCAGDGAMVRVLEAYGLSVFASDVEPRHDGIDTANFLMAKRAPAKAMITNPPFALAADIIEHALATLKLDYVALLLKSTYWHADKRASLWQRFRPSSLYPLTWRVDFTLGGNPVMDVSWTIWDRRSAQSHCHYVPLPRPSLNPNQQDFL